MKTETLEIKKTAAIKAYDEATSKGKTLLENLLGKNVFIKNIRERIQSVNDIFDLNNTTEADFNKKWEGHDESDKWNAFEKLMVLAYNGGKIADFTDGTDKYYPRFVMGSSSGVGFACTDYVSWNACSTVGSRLVFCGPDAYENMLDAVKKFLPEYEKSRKS
jgi:hypothetical protein